MMRPISKMEKRPGLDFDGMDAVSLTTYSLVPFRWRTSDMMVGGGCRQGMRTEFEVALLSAKRTSHLSNAPVDIWQI